MKNLNKFTTTIQDIPAVTSMSDLYCTMAQVGYFCAEGYDLLLQYNTVAGIKESIKNNSIGTSFITYAGESLVPFAPAFVEGNSAKAVEQMEEGLKAVGKKIKAFLVKLIEKIKAFFSKIINHFKKSGKAEKTMQTLRDRVDETVDKIDAGGLQDEWVRSDVTLYLFTDGKSGVEQMLALYEACENAIQYVKKGQYEKIGDIKPDSYHVAIATPTTMELTPTEYYGKLDVILKEPKLLAGIEGVYKKLKNLKIADDMPSDEATIISELLVKTNKAVSGYLSIIETVHNSFGNIKK